MGCSSCGQSRGRGPRSPMRHPVFVVFDVENQPIAIHPSRAEAAREVRQRNAVLDQDEVAAGHHFRWELRRVALDGSDPIGEAIRTARCVGCADGKVPVEPAALE